MYGILDLHTLFDVCDIFGRRDIGLDGKLLRGRGIAFVDQVVHDDGVDVTVIAMF
jgi:hypothetical protein